jgi:hypothetical protein
VTAAALAPIIALMSKGLLFAIAALAAAAGAAAQTRPAPGSSASQSVHGAPPAVASGQTTPGTSLSTEPLDLGGTLAAPAAPAVTGPDGRPVRTRAAPAPAAAAPVHVIPPAPPPEPGEDEDGGDAEEAGDRGFPWWLSVIAVIAIWYVLANLGDRKRAE